MEAKEDCATVPHPSAVAADRRMPCRPMLWFFGAWVVTLTLATAATANAQGPMGAQESVANSNLPLQLSTRLANLPAAQPKQPLLQLGSGDAVQIKVFGRPEFDTTTYVSDHGTIAVPLAGEVQVLGKSPAMAAEEVARALRAGGFLVDPQVSLTLVEFRSQQASVLGEVRNPGRFAVDSRMSVLDLIAQAGGVSEAAADVVYLLRYAENDRLIRYPVDLSTLVEGDATLPEFTIRGGDSIVVPKAPHYYVYGEVNSPNMYRLEPGTTVVQAISRSGGLTEKGSDRRIEIKRRTDDGEYETFDADLTDVVRADDVIRVKERIF